MIREILPVALSLASLLPGFGASAADPAQDAREVIAEILAAESALHPPLVERLIALGPEALAPVQEARRDAPEGDVRRSLDRAARWIVAAEVREVLRRGIETQLTFDGQYDELRERASEAADALLALLDDETTAVEVRIAACRALADIGDPAVVPRLRALFSDVLLFPIIRNEIGIVLATFGDRYPVERELAEYERLKDVRDPRVRRLASLQLANLHYRIRDYARAAETYEEVIELTRRILDAYAQAGVPPEKLEPLQDELHLHFYNAACSNTLAGNLDRAKDYLRRAVKGHPEHLSNIEKDGDLQKLREDPSYEAFRKELERLFEGKTI